MTINLPGRVPGANEPTPARRDLGGGPPGRIVVHGPEEMVRSIPSLLGFYPFASLVLIAFRTIEPGDPGEPGDRAGHPRRVVEVTVRVDLPDPDPATWVGQSRQLLGQLAETLRDLDISAVIAVVIDERPECRRPGNPLVRSLFRTCSREGWEVMAAIAVRAIAPGEGSVSLIDGAAGEALADPAVSELAVAHVVAGRTTFADRDQLGALVAAEPEEITARRGTILDAAAGRYFEALADLGLPADSRGHQWPAQARKEVRARLAKQPAIASARFFAASHAAVWEFLTGELLDRAAGEGLSEDDYVSAAIILGREEIRHLALALSYTPRRDAACALWLALARGLAGQDRAVALTLVGFDAYSRGEGALAGIALSEADDLMPFLGTARELLRGLEMGAPPGALASYVAEAAELAQVLGLSLGPFSRRTD